jgi:dipeptide/tripeptide permease
MHDDVAGRLDCGSTDRVQRVLGWIAHCLSHFSMAVPSLCVLSLGLVLIVIGTGLLKAMWAGIVGRLYRRMMSDGTPGVIFYMGSHGAFVARSCADISASV